MSSIVTAIDAEIVQLEQRTAALRGLRALASAIGNGHAPDLVAELAEFNRGGEMPEPPSALVDRSTVVIPGESDPAPTVAEPEPEPEVEPPSPPRRSDGGPTTAERIFAAIEELAPDGGWVKAREVSEVLGSVNPSTRATAMATLRRQKRIETEGTGRATRYRLARREPPPEPEQPSAEDRAERSVRAETDAKQLENWIRQQGQVTVAEVAVHLDTTEAVAKRRLTAMLKATDLALYGEHYRFTASPPPDADGAKTAVERRIVAAVREGAPIDEPTLAFHSQTTVLELRNIASALLRRGVLERREEEGVTLYELPVGVSGA